MAEYTDTQLIDFLEELNGEADYSGACILRLSTTGRGWRLHETQQEGSKPTVREAIVDFMENGQ